MIEFLTHTTRDKRKTYCSPYIGERRKQQKIFNVNDCIVILYYNTLRCALGTFHILLYVIIIIIVIPRTCNNNNNDTGAYVHTDNDDDRGGGGGCGNRRYFVMA